MIKLHHWILTPAADETMKIYLIVALFLGALVVAHSLEEDEKVELAETPEQPEESEDGEFSRSNDFFLISSQNALVLVDAPTPIDQSIFGFTSECLFLHHCYTETFFYFYKRYILNFVLSFLIYLFCISSSRS